MLRFTLLLHDFPFTHWDLLLESGDSLRTWRLHERPAMGKNVMQKIVAELLSDHRLVYLDYEGPVSGDRGTVSRVDSGVYISLEQTASHWQIRLEGTALQGFATLIHSDTSTQLLWLADEVEA